MGRDPPWSERTPQQVDHDLDTFWNALVAGEAPLPASAETAMVARLATLETAPAPRAGFLDALWTQLLVPESNGHLDAQLLPDESMTVAPVVPIAVLPVRPVVDTRSGIQRWGTLAAAIAALLVVAAVGALLAIEPATSVRLRPRRPGR